jgi:choice-of-anchor C domain-containing protein
MSLLLGSAAHAGGDTGLPVNGSFEDGPANGGGFSRVVAPSTAIPGWAVVSGSVDHIGTMWQAADGIHSLDLSGCEEGTIEQWIPTTPGTQYTLSFMLSGNWGGDPIKNGSVGAGESMRPFSFDTSQVTHLNMGWTSQQTDFTATGASTRIWFQSLSPLFWGPAIDDVRVTVIPTPGAAALLTVAAGGMAVRRGRRARCDATL